MIPDAAKQNTFIIGKVSAATTVKIVARQNGVGLDRDIQLVQRALPEQWPVEYHSVRSMAPLRSRLSRWGAVGRSPDHALNILIERVPLAWSYSLGRKVLIPNQERFPLRHLARLGRIDRVLCKSRHAEAIFREQRCETRFIGFTSVDRYLPDVRPDFSKFLHLAGRSTLKGTAMLLELWRQHPGWPPLTLVQHPDNAPKHAPANVNLIVDYLTDEVLRRIQNDHGIHLCPSLSEGWGHYIAEGMSCGALVVTTDAPPMNELVDASRGCLVPWLASHPRHLGTNYVVNPQAMKAAVESLLHTAPAEIEQRAKAAREWFLENDRGFSARFRAAIEDWI